MSRSGFVGCYKHDIDFYVGCADCKKNLLPWAVDEFRRATNELSLARDRLRRLFPKHKLLEEERGHKDFTVHDWCDDA